MRIYLVFYILLLELALENAKLSIEVFKVKENKPKYKVEQILDI